MKLLGIRFCAVAEEAVPMAQFFTKGLGLAERDLGGDADTFSGCVLPAGPVVPLHQKLFDRRTYPAPVPGRPSGK